MVGTRFIIGAIIAWLVLLATANMLFRGKGKNRNPLDWPEVDRCLFLVSIFFFLGVVFNTTSGIIYILYSNGPSYMNRAFLEPFMQVIRVLEREGKGEEGRRGIIQRLSKRAAEIELERALEPLTNIKMNLSGVEDKMNLSGVEEELAVRNLYGKISDCCGEERRTCLLRFTSVPPEVAAYFQAHRQYAAEA